MFLFSFFSFVFLFSFSFSFFLCPSHLSTWEDIRENLYQILFFGRPATSSLCKAQTDKK